MSEEKFKKNPNEYKTINVWNIEYCIEDEDIDENTNFNKEEILSSLPKEMKFDIYCNEFDEYEDFEDYFKERDFEYDISDWISDKTGWLIYGYEFKIEN